MDNAPDTRASLLLRLREARDEQAWQDFVEIYGPLISRLAKRYGLQEADAGDVSQEVLGRVAKAVQTWEHDPARGSFRGWLTRVTRNLTIELFRQRRRRSTVHDAQAQLEQIAAPSDEDQTFDWEQRKQLFLWGAQKAAPCFAANTWQAFWQTAVEHQPVGDVARRLGMTPGAVYIARSRVMARIRTLVEQSEFDSLTWRGEP